MSVVIKRINQRLSEEIEHRMGKQSLKFDGSTPQIQKTPSSLEELRTSMVFTKEPLFILTSWVGIEHGMIDKIILS